MPQKMQLQIPNSQRVIYAGDNVKLGRFSSEIWIVQFGWFTFGGNRPFCGWYLVSKSDEARIKPLQLPDLDDIYFVERK